MTSLPAGPSAVEHASLIRDQFSRQAELFAAAPSLHNEAALSLLVTQTFYRVATERDGLMAASFPANDDRDLLRRMIDESVEGDTLGMQSRREGSTVLLSYPSVILSARKPAA